MDCYFLSAKQLQDSPMFSTEAKIKQTSCQEMNLRTTRNNTLQQKKKVNLVINPLEIQRLKGHCHHILSYFLIPFYFERNLTKIVSQGIINRKLKYNTENKQGRLD